MRISYDTITFLISVSWIFFQHFIANTCIACLVLFLSENLELNLKIFMAVNVLISGILTGIRFYIGTGKIIDAGVNILYGIGRRSDHTFCERAEGDLNRVRFFLMKKEFARALDIVNEILGKEGGLPDALYLKARIMWEGFQDADAAEKCLIKIIELVPDENQAIHRWALNFCNKLRVR